MLIYKLCKLLRTVSSSKQLLSKKIFVRNLLFYTYLPSLCKEFFEMRHNLEHSSSHLLNIKPLLKSGLHMIFPFHLIILAPNLQTNLIKLLENQKTCKVWQNGLWSFQTGGTKLERLLPKNQHTLRKFLNFENWTNGEVSKSAKSPNLLTFKVNFLYQKLSESFSIFFSLKNINLGAHFLLLAFFDSINF